MKVPAREFKENLGALVPHQTPGRACKHKGALPHSFVHDTAIPAFVSIAICGLALAVGAFALRGCRIAGLTEEHQIKHLWKMGE